MATVQRIKVVFDTDDKDLDSTLKKLEKAGQISKKNAAQFKKDSKAFESAQKKRSRLLEEEIEDLNELKDAKRKAFNPKEVREYGARIKETQKRVDALKGETKKLDKANQGLAVTMKSVKRAIIGAFAIERLVRFGVESVKLAAQAEGIRTAFLRLNKATLLDDLRKATRGTVSDLDLMKRAVSASNFRIPLEELAKLFKFATERSIETGLGVEFLVKSITEGIGKREVRILDNLGISAKRVSEAFKETGNFTKAAMRVISEELALTGIVVDTTTTKIERLEASFANLQVTAGTVLIDAFTAVGTVFSDAGENTETFTRNMAALGAAGGVNNTVFQQLRILFSGLNDEEKALINSLDTTSSELRAQALAADQAAEAARVLAKRTKEAFKEYVKLTEQIQSQQQLLQNTVDLYDELSASIDAVTFSLFAQRDATKAVALEELLLNAQLDEQIDTEDDETKQRLIEEEREFKALIKTGEEKERQAARELALRARAQDQAIGDLSQLVNLVASANKDQAEFAKALALTAAIINTAQSVSKTIAEFGFTPIGIAAAAAAAALGAVQISTIQSQSIPSNAEGTEFVDREGRFPHGVDKVPSWLDRGEAVINRRSNSKYPGLAKAFNENEVNNWMDRNYFTPNIRVDNSNDFEDRNIVESISNGTRKTKETNMLLKQLISTQRGSHGFRVN